MKLYSIKVDTNKASQTTRIQLQDDRGCRPGRRPATPSRPARQYVGYFTEAKVVKGAATFSMLREELEREVN